MLQLYKREAENRFVCLCMQDEPWNFFYKVWKNGLIPAFSSQLNYNKEALVRKTGIKTIIKLTCLNHML